MGESMPQGITTESSVLPDEIDPWQARIAATNLMEDLRRRCIHRPSTFAKASDPSIPIFFDADYRKDQKDKEGEQPED
jgi:hypothetical protein